MISLAQTQEKHQNERRIFKSSLNPPVVLSKVKALIDYVYTLYTRYCQSYQAANFSMFSFPYFLGRRNTAEVAVPKITIFNHQLEFNLNKTSLIHIKKYETCPEHSTMAPSCLPRFKFSKLFSIVQTPDFRL